MVSFLDLVSNLIYDTQAFQVSNHIIANTFHKYSFSFEYLRGKAGNFHPNSSTGNASLLKAINYFYKKLHRRC